MLCHVYFNPRSPQGKRQTQSVSLMLLSIFQSTLPAGEATDTCSEDLRGKDISIHAPRRGSDLAQSSPKYSDVISIHAPRRGSDEYRYFPSMITGISIHAPRRGSDSTVKAYSNDRIKRSTLREPHFLFSKNACFSPIVSMCATTSHTKNQRIRVSFGSYPGLAPTCFTLAWYRFPRL